MEGASYCRHVGSDELHDEPISVGELNESQLGNLVRGIPVPH
jgi:hypothetical protein